MHVEAEGNRTSPCPGEIWNCGWSSLKPSNGGRLQLVTNLSSCCFCLSVNEEMTSQNILMQGWSSLYSPVDVCVVCVCVCVRGWGEGQSILNPGLCPHRLGLDRLPILSFFFLPLLNQCRPPLIYNRVKYHIAHTSTALWLKPIYMHNNTVPAWETIMCTVIQLPYLNKMCSSGDQRYLLAFLPRR